MNRPLHIWSVFALCTLVLLGAVTWVTATALRLHQAQAKAQRAAELEEKVRLALWRMDSLLTPLVVQESSWPYFAYNSHYPAERAYNRMFNDAQNGDTLIASPLLGINSTNVLLHFQLNPDGTLSSPQVPPTKTALGNNAAMAQATLSASRERLAQLRKLVAPTELLAACPPTARGSEAMAQVIQAPAYTNAIVLGNNGLPSPGRSPGAPARVAQSFQNSVELQARAQNVQQALNIYADNNTALRNAAPRRASVVEGVMKPVWFGDALVLARRVTVGGRDYVQGCWLDWAGLQSTLLDSARDLLPGARLEPVRVVPEDQQSRLLAALPVRLVPVETQPEGSAGFSPLMFALIAAWACMLLAAIAVGVLLNGAISLSERRGAFVSAVTHELRTPLTTFKMYSEMLADGMVTEESKRQQYLATLCAEANRLGHLVENVLAYARLERGSARTRIEKLALGDLIDRALPRLRERADRSDMKLVVDADESALRTVVHVDAAAVEQILFNLVDNACKYAAPHASEKVIHFEALPDRKFAMLRVRDHGAGISEGGARRLFQPFSKSAQEAAHSAPGIGLGLALCRRLSRSLGGDLRLVKAATTGACFELRLPLVAQHDAALNSI